MGIVFEGTNLAGKRIGWFHEYCVRGIMEHSGGCYSVVETVVEEQRVVVMDLSHSKWNISL